MGQLTYARGRSDFFKRASAARAHVMDEAEFERWLRQAEHTLESARSDMEDGDYDWACFKAHQAAEYALKGLLRALGRGAFGHSVFRLIREVADLGLEVGPELLRAARRLDRHYLAPRYPNQWAEGAPVDYYDEQDAGEAISEAKSIIEAVRTWHERLRSG